MSGQTIDSSALLGCPFCGSDDVAVVAKDDGWHAVVCDGCALFAEWDSGRVNPFEAAEDWNRRVANKELSTNDKEVKLTL